MNYNTSHLTKCQMQILLKAYKHSVIFDELKKLKTFDKIDFDDDFICLASYGLIKALYPLSQKNLMFESYELTNRGKAVIQTYKKDSWQMWLPILISAVALLVAIFK